MKKLRFHISLVLLVLFVLACKQREDIRQYAAIEVYPEDSILQRISDKRAMIVIAHDDDMCAMSGTISQLNKQGWKISVISISKSVESDAAQIKAGSHILDTVIFVDLKPSQYRNDLKTVKYAYDAIPKEAFDTVFNGALIEAHYLEQIQAFNPSVIFTLDNEIGGYGHPEHVFVSQMVIDLAAEQKINPKYIYQSVYTPHMDSTIMNRHARRMKSWGYPDDEWERAKRTYGVNGMPEPTVQVNIRSEAKEKMNYLRSYNERERKTMGFFIPEFEKYDAEEYFGIFDREFFRVIAF